MMFTYKLIKIFFLILLILMMTAAACSFAEVSPGLDVKTINADTSYGYSQGLSKNIKCKYFGARKQYPHEKADCEQYTYEEFDAQNISRKDKQSIQHYFRFCTSVSTETNGDKKKAFYFFHGSGGTEKSAYKKKAFEPIRDKLKENGYSFVSISYPDRVLKEEERKFMLDCMLPKFEDAYNLQHKDRAGMGVSMGGFNLGSLLVHDNNHSFSKAILICPAIYPTDQIRKDRSLIAPTLECEEFANDGQQAISTLAETAFKIAYRLSPKVATDVDLITAIDNKYQDEKIWCNPFIMDRKPRENELPAIMQNTEGQIIAYKMMSGNKLVKKVLNNLKSEDVKNLQFSKNVRVDLTADQCNLIRSQVSNSFNNVQLHIQATIGDELLSDVYAPLFAEKMRRGGAQIDFKYVKKKIFSLIKHCDYSSEAIQEFIDTSF